MQQGDEDETKEEDCKEEEVKADGNLPLMDNPMTPSRTQTTNSTCDQRCSLHGACVDGRCLCSKGWNGKHCTLPGLFTNTFSVDFVCKPFNFSYQSKSKNSKLAR